MRAGERFARDMELGPVPAVRLRAAMEAALAILVLMVDATRGISGAACRLPELDVVLIARRSRWTQALRPGARTVPPSHLGRHASRTSRRRGRYQPQPGGKARQQLRCRRPDARGSSHVRWRLGGPGPERVDCPAERGGRRAAGHLLRLAVAPGRPWALDQEASGVDPRGRAAEQRPRTHAASTPHAVLEGLSRRCLGPRWIEVTYSVRRAAALVGLPIEGLVELLTAHRAEHAIDL